MKEFLDILLDALSMVIQSFVYDFYLYDYLEAGLNAVRYYVSNNSVDKYIAEHEALGKDDTKRFSSLFTFMKSLLYGFVWSRELFGQIKKNLILPEDELKVFEDLISACFENVRNESNSNAIDVAMDNYHNVMNAVRNNDSEHIDLKDIAIWDIWDLLTRCPYNYYDYEIPS